MSAPRYEPSADDLEAAQAAKVQREGGEQDPLLDEFQDTSHAQLALFSGLYGDGHCVMAVGDPQQSIYGFRGASLNH